MNASWITQFEHHLEQLENCAAETQTTPERAAQSAAEALRILGDVADLTVDIRRGLQRSRVFPAADAACTTPAIAASQPTATTDNSDDQLFKEAVRAQQVASVRLSDSAGDGAIRWCCVRPLADGIDCAVAVTSHLLTADNRSFREGFQACGDLLSGVVGRNLLTRHEQLQQARREVGHVLTRLTAATCEADVASIAAQDISAAVTCALLAAVRDRPHNIRQPLSKSSEDCRVSFLVAGRAVLKVRAVTGVSRPHPESETVRGIEAVAGEIQRTGRWNVWLDSADCEALPTGRYLRYRLIPLIEKNESATTAAARSTGSPPDASGVMSNGAHDEMPGSSNSHSREPQNTSVAEKSESIESMPPPSAAVLLETSSADVFPDEELVRELTSGIQAAWQRIRAQHSAGLLSRLFRHPARWLGAAAVIIALVVWPTTLEIEVTGQIMAGARRHVFAPENGTVESVDVENEQQVAAGQRLLKLTNPDFLLEDQRLQGEIDTTTARLAAVRTARLTNNSTASLSGDEQQLQTQLDNLRRRRTLMEQQLSSLEVVADVSGTVRHHHARQELLSRPVQRGQLLMELIPEDAHWQLELQIPDHLLGYVRSAAAASSERPVVRYFVRSNPDGFRTTQLTELDDSVQIYDGRLECRGIAPLQPNFNDTQLRSGTSVTARIRCGKRSLGFVLFREIFEFLQQLRFRWF